MKNRGGHFAPAEVVTLNRPGVVSLTGISNQAEYCMEDTELTDFLLAADLIVNDYNDPLNDGGMWGIMILDGEGARPIGKDFVSISIEDLFLMVGGSTFMHNYKITYGIPSYHTPD